MLLFAEDKLSFEKTASAELEEDATQWPRQVLTELFRVLPEISEYTPDVKFMHVNEEQGYALGVVVVTNGTNTALTTHVGAASKKPPRALIPIIVKNGRLCPLDTVMSSAGKMYPLTADRIREVLYRPEAFDLLSDDWNDSSIWQLFNPPGRHDFGTGTPAGGAASGQGVQYMMGPGMKMAGLLEAIDGTILAPHIEEFTRQLRADPTLLKVALANPHTHAPLDLLSNTEAVTEKHAASYEQMLEERHPAQVVHMAWTGEAYAIKTANRDHGAMRSFQLDRGGFLKFAGPKLAAKVDTEGSVVAAAPAKEPVLIASGRGETARRIERSGRYTVYEAVTGKPHAGHVFTQLVDGEGNQTPIAVFISAEGAVVQDQIAGVFGDTRAEDLPGDPPKGQGIFIGSREGYEYVATVPVQVNGSTSDGQSTRYRCVDLTGEDLTIVLSRDTKAVMCFPARKEILMPWTAVFASTEHELPELISKAPEEEPRKIGVAGLLESSIKIASLGQDMYTLHYRQLPKLAAALEGRSLDVDDAVFTLCVAGLSPEDAHHALHKAADAGAYTVPACDIGEPPTVDKTKIAAGVKEVQALRTNLLKEAAELPDAMTVDAVLSLEFINSENVRTFISMIPYLEKALNRVCELVFASRLGLNEVPEAAGSRAARGLNDVIRGLKALALRQIDELP